MFNHFKCSFQVYIYDQESNRDLKVLSTPESMSLYHGLVYAILVVELITLTLLGLPLPLVLKKPVIKALSKPLLSSTVQITIKCVLGFILLLFVDSMNRVYGIESELDRMKESGVGTYPHGKTEILSRKFFWQRNMYLTGITLFLTFLLTRVATLVWELFDMKDAYETTLKTKQDELPPKQKSLAKEIADIDEEIARLKEQSTALQEQMK
ncbi:endoplasmic reticulum transmembrane protein 3 [Kluyveromyces marxianus]|uniref:Endoplasmic reticulum transmembrane protein n=2 Tax=Kluyveromyces marxianus TaxID=4911 RepID=W0TBT5_KLUMD|nr:endoplasmic reticulum transmembrane protein 3 [Kluyveromyces marxianus DMKU3-1042]QGN16211.1 endoplasmic reticulum transmembrane protein 3 [Kluyveromyces marxianus]BAO40483.1 endoplasmic reticulum transmembrane protein 3 [Kluyveromyces marxianus DMKU3-1042]BAP71967.1 endoplasmic reticulum transmembrane protein 3 [Kluyveromyces marxianus]